MKFLILGPDPRVPEWTHKRLLSLGGILIIDHPPAIGCNEMKFSRNKENDPLFIAAPTNSDDRQKRFNKETSWTFVLNNT